MEFVNWDIIVTLVIAIYGAILSSYSIWLQNKNISEKLKSSWRMVFKGTSWAK